MVSVLLRSVALSLVIGLALVLGGPTFSESSFVSVFGADPGPNCDTPGLQTMNCVDKNNQYCGVQYDKCRASQGGIRQDDLCGKLQGNAACSNSACDLTKNPSNSDIIAASSPTGCKGNTPP
jgi:hypothetical protein